MELTGRYRTGVLGLAIPLLLASTTLAHGVDRDAIQGLEAKQDRKQSKSAHQLENGDLISIAKKLQERRATRIPGKMGLPLRYAGPDVRRQLTNLQKHPISLPTGGQLVARSSNSAGTTPDPFPRGWYVKRRDEKGTPSFVTIPPAMRSKQGRLADGAFPAAAMDFLEKNRDRFILDDPRRELELVKRSTDGLGKQHIKYRQTYCGIPLWAHDLVVHMDTSGEVYAFNGFYIPTPRDLPTTDATITAEQAMQIALADLRLTTTVMDLGDRERELLDYDRPVVTKYIWVERETKSNHLIWHIQVRPNLRDNWYYFVDALTGEILEKYNATASESVTGQGVDLHGLTRTFSVYRQSGTHYMIDATRETYRQTTGDIREALGTLETLDLLGNDPLPSNSIYYTTSPDNTWSDQTSVSAHFNVGKTYEYFYNTHNRLGLDGISGTMISIIHVTDGGKPMDNAYWNGRFMAYGDGDRVFTPLAGGLDVAAHEMTHGVIDHTVNLEYKFQSGALNESFADVFGAMVDDEDWLLGEDVIVASYFPSGAMRDMSDPHNGASDNSDPNWQPAHMSEYQDMEISEDNGGVHVNSGIPNKACYLIAQAIGREKTEKIYYRILAQHYLNSQSNFDDMRAAAIQAATDLYGNTEINAVKDGFAGVGIGEGGTGAEPPGDQPHVDGEEWIALVDGHWASPNLYLARPVIEKDSTDIVLLTETEIYTGGANPISVTDDGEDIIFIDSQNRLAAIFSDGTEEVFVDTSRIWSSISLSPDGTKVAAITLLEEPVIFILDLVSPEESRSIELYSPTTEGDGAYVVEFADAIDWDVSSQILIYDCYIEMPQDQGGTISYWDVNALDVTNDIIHTIFGPLPDDISIVNPSWSQVNPNFFAFDIIYRETDLVSVMVVDLFSQSLGQIESNDNSLGYPKFSPDDSRIVFSYRDTGTPTVRQIPIKESRLEPAGASEDYLWEALLPTWFAVGERTLDFDAPDLHASILASSVLPDHIAAYAISDEPLQSDASGAFHFLPTFGNPTTLNKSMPALAGHDVSVYYAQHELSGSGVLELRISGSDEFGNQGSVEHSVTVSKVGESGGFAITSLDGAVALRGGEGSADGNGYVLLDEAPYADSPGAVPAKSAFVPTSLLPVGQPFHLFGTVSLARPATIVARYSGRETAGLGEDLDVRKIGFYRLTGGAWDYVGGRGGDGKVEVAIDQFGIFSLFHDAAQEELPRTTALRQNFPNPFNPLTTIRYELPGDGPAALTIHNLAGQRVRTLEDGMHKAGLHSVIWNGRNDRDEAVAAGIYLYRLRFGDENHTRKMLLIK